MIIFQNVESEKCGSGAGESSIFSFCSRKLLGYNVNCVWRVFEGCSEPNGQKLEARARQNAKSVVLSTVFGLLWGGGTAASGGTTRGAEPTYARLN